MDKDVEEFLINGELSQEFYNKQSWKESGLSVGLLISQAEIFNDDQDFMLGLMGDPLVDPVSRGFFCSKMLQWYRKMLERGNNLSKPDENKLINLLIPITESIEGILSLVGNLRTILCNEYNSCFNLIQKSFGINDYILKTFKVAWTLREPFQLQCSLYLLSRSEIEMLENFNDTGKLEILCLLARGCRIVNENRVNPSEILSIVIFNKLYAYLHYNQKFSREEVEIIQAIKNEFMGNFTQKQKGRLGEEFSKIFSDSGMQSDRNYAEEPKNIERVHEQQRVKNISQSFYENKRDPWVSDEEHKDVKNGIQVLFDDIRKTIRRNDKISIDVLSERLLDLYKISSKVLCSILESNSYNEKYYTIESATMWSSIESALNYNNQLQPLLTKKLLTNITYIRRNSKY